MIEDGTTIENAAERGRAAAEQLVYGWPELTDLDELDSVEFAEAALGRLAELIADQPPLFQASRRGSERGAESLSARPFQGIVESIQNADDLAATELRVAIRADGDRRELLIAHNGTPISLRHVGAMVLPWVSTKVDDPLASGRFGIGQKTLRALGGPIEAHCRPYHFRMGEAPIACPPELDIPGLYDAGARETVLVVPLSVDIESTALEQFMTDLGAKALVFLRSVRRVTLVALETGTTLVDHRLHQRRREVIEVAIRDHLLECEVAELTDFSEGQSYSRYLVEMPLKADEQRNNKATGLTTPLGISVPQRAEHGLLYDRLPLPVPSRLPVGLNAQFDPDTGRSTLHERTWNAHRFSELGDLLAAVALQMFDSDAPRGWSAVPLLEDTPEGTSDWLRERYALDVIGRCHVRLADELRLGPDNDRRTLDELVFEADELEDVLTVHDQELLADGLLAIPPEQRGPSGRWRIILKELARSRLLELEDALTLLDLDDDQLGEREPAWYLAFAVAAINARMFEKFCARPGIRLSGGERVTPPRPDEPRSLVIRVEPESLATRLGLTLMIDPVYIANDGVAPQVRGELEAAGLLVDAYESDREALALLARGRRDRIRLDDKALLSLRDAFERLRDDQQRDLGPKIGKAIELRTICHTENRRTQTGWAPPAKSYLPPQIDRETDSFGRAAAKTPGITWLAPDYARVLRRTGGRLELGAQRLLVGLGARTLPQLVPPPNESSRYSRDPRPTSLIESWQLPEIQATQIRALGQRVTDLLDDRWSPDLDRVIADIQQDRAGPGRRRRAAALLGLLARGWDRHFADDARAQAVWAYDGYWNSRGDVTATWLARAATAPWLPNARGSLRAPRDLHLQTEANRLSVGETRSAYLMPVADYVLRSPVIAALGIRRGPSAKDIVKGLEELRDTGKIAPHVEAQARTAYRILALSCSADGRGQRPVDDMTVASLRSRFDGGRGAQANRGLLLIDRQWYAPDQVFSGLPIFGRWRPFVAQSPLLEPLWRTLHIPRPGARDCVAVLRELANNPLEDRDRPVLIETMRALIGQLEGTTPQLRTALRLLPVWTGVGWTSRRPVWAIADETIAAAVADQAPIWQPGFQIDSMRTLVAALGLILIEPDEFVPIANAGYGAASGEEFRSRFALAVEHLRTELARSDQSLYETLTVRWEDLAAGQLVLDPDLEVAADIAAGRRLVAPAAAHLIRRPLTLFARSADAVGAADGGGRALAELFTGDRQKAAWAWSAMWQKAGAGIAADRIILSSDVSDDDPDTERLAQLQLQSEKRRGRKSKKPGTTPTKGSSKFKNQVKVRKLKEIDKLEPGPGAIVNPGAPRGGVIIPPQRPKGSTRRGASRLGAPGATTQNGSPPGPNGGKPPTVLPPMTEREQLAYDAVIAALSLDEGQVADLRGRRGVGADALDELRQCYEIKMSSGRDIPNEVTLTPNEIDRARTDPDFFLAIVAGLEDGAGELRVRFIFDPLSRLPLRLRRDMTFGGVRDAEALEYVFPKAVQGADSGASGRGSSEPAQPDGSSATAT